MHAAGKGLPRLAVKLSRHLPDAVISVSETLTGRRLCRRFVETQWASELC